MPPTITTTTFPIIHSGTNPNYDITVTGVTGTLSASLQSGTLPSGLSLSCPNNSTIRVSGIPSDDLRFAFTIRATDSNGGAYDDQAYVTYCVPLLDASKPLLTIMGDSISAGTSLPTSPEDDGIKAKITRLIGTAFDIVVFGYPGYQVPGVMSDYANTGATVYNAARSKNYLLVQGGANDIQADSPTFGGSGTLTGSALASRFQTALNTAKATGYRTIANTVLAWGGLGYNETTRLNCNTAILDSGFTKDLTCDIGGNSLFNSVAATANLTYYISDTVHLSAEGNRVWAQEIVETIGADSGLPLLAVFDIDSSYTLGTSITPVNIPFGGTGAKTWQWKVDGSNVSSSQNPTLTISTAGSHTVTLEVTTEADGTKSFTRTVLMRSAGDIGGGSLSLSASEIAQGGTTTATASGITSPIFKAIDGLTATFSGSGSSRTVTSTSPFASGSVRAAEDIYQSVGGGTTTNQDWQQTSVGSPTTVYNPHLTAVGDKIRFYIPNRFAGNSTIGLWEQSSGNKWYIEPAGNVKQAASGVTTSQATGQTWVQDDAIDFEIVDVSGSQKIKVSKNGVAIITCANAKNSGFYIYPVIYSEDTIGQTPSANVTYKRPDLYGTGVTNWKQGVASLSILSAPTAGFSLNTTAGNIKAGVTLAITDSSTGAESYEYKITNSAYTAQVVGFSQAPDLTKYLRMGSNTIEQTVSNSVSDDSDSITFTVIDNVITIPAGTTSYDLTGLSSEITLTGYVQSIDNADNVSEASNTDTITI